MNILFISLEYRNLRNADNDPNNSVTAPGENDVAAHRIRRLLPIQMLAIAADLIDAGHKVHWPEESLTCANMERIIGFLVDRIGRGFFACGDQRSHGLMANVAIRVGGISGNQFLNDSMLRPARYWRDQLTDDKLSVQHLLNVLGGFETSRHKTGA